MGSLILIEEILIFILVLTVSYLVYQHVRFKNEIYNLSVKDIEKAVRIENALCAVKEIGTDVNVISQKIEQHLSNPVCCKDKIEQIEIIDEVIKLTPIEKDLKAKYRTKRQSATDINFKVYYPSEKTKDFTNLDALIIVQNRLYSKEIYPTLTELNDIVEFKGRTKDPLTVYLKVAYSRAKKSLYDKFRRG
jgi:hypothetical protein